MRAVLVGLGAVGARSARQLLSSKSVSELVVLSRKPALVEGRVAALGASGMVRLEQLRPAALAQALSGPGVLLLAAPDPGGELAAASVRASVPVVSVSDDPAEVRALLELDGEARRRGVAVAAGAGMAPGLSCMLAAWAVAKLDEVTEVHVATLGTGGPACARRRHDALREVLDEWRDGAWARKMAGSGRELVWFPGYSGADCYRVQPARPVAADKGFSHVTSGQRQGRGLPPGPLHLPPAHAAAAAPRRDGGRRQGGGARATRRRGRGGHPRSGGASCPSRRDSGSQRRG